MLAFVMQKKEKQESCSELIVFMFVFFPFSIPFK